MSLEAVIRLDQVSKRYGHRVALNGVTLAVPPGVVFGLLGEK
jgi:ABC-type multidrug transport system ATPase subunit